MDERDYDTFWMAEHHFQPEGTELIPNLLMMAMHNQLFFSLSARARARGQRRKPAASGGLPPRCHMRLFLSEGRFISPANSSKS
jgi:hypothetical protein